MKKLILIISIVLLCCNNITAQNLNDYNFFVRVIDSLKTKYSVKDFVNSVEIPYKYRQHYSDLSENDQNKVIDYVYNLYHQKEYIGLYRLASGLLSEYYFYSKDDVKKRIIEIWYDKRCYSSSLIVDLGSSKYYTQHTKDRLLEIAEKRWTEEDIDAWTLFIKQSRSIESYKREIKSIMSKTNRKGKKIEKFLLDSLTQDRVEKELPKNINKPLNKWVVLMIGSLSDQRFIPSLERTIDEYKEHEDYPQIKEACMYALAKLGVQKYIDDIFANAENIKWGYLGTKEACLRWLEINFDWNKTAQFILSGSSFPKPFVMMSDITYHVKNIPNDLQLPWLEIYEYEKSFLRASYQNYDPLKDEENKEFIQKIYRLYQWIKENPDKWKLPPAQDSY